MKPYEHERTKQIKWNFYLQKFFACKKILATIYLFILIHMSTPHWTLLDVYYTLSTCCTRAPGPPGRRPPRCSCTSPCTWPPPTPRRSCPRCRSRRGCRPGRCPRGCTAAPYCRPAQRSPSGGCQSRPCIRRSPICRAATEPSAKFSQSRRRPLIC